MAGRLIITEWALQSYLELVGHEAFTRRGYKTTVRPDVELLRDGLPSHHQKLADVSFFSQALDKNGATIAHGHQMKWHMLGPNRVELRLCVVDHGDDVFLCQAFVRDSEATEQREMAKLKTHINHIAAGSYQTRGIL